MPSFRCIEHLMGRNIVTWGSFLQDQRSWIWMPESMRVEVSDDGEAWRAFGAASHEVDPKQNGTVRRVLAATGATRARYVRLVAESVGRCPSWHPGAGDQAWIFVDEIGVE